MLQLSGKYVYIRKLQSFAIDIIVQSLAINDANEVNQLNCHHTSMI